MGDVNVVGILPGSDPELRDEAIVIGAHHDHMGVGEPVDGDSIYNGADDDASGVVAVLEIARALARGPAPRRTVVCLFSTAEEVQYAIEQVVRAVNELRQLSPLYEMAQEGVDIRQVKWKND